MRFPRLWLVWSCLIVFACRLSAQVFVGIYSPDWLPPFNEWYWGFVPYPPLFLFELGLLMLMTVAAYDCTRTDGWFYRELGKHRLIFDWLLAFWFLENLGRYILTMALLPDHRWFKGTIPIACNFVLMLFLYSCVRHARARNAAA